MWYKFIVSNSGRDAHDTNDNNNNIHQFGDEYDSIKISFSLHNKLPSYINYNSYSKVHAALNCIRILGFINWRINNLNHHQIVTQMLQILVCHTCMYGIVWVYESMYAT